MSETLRDYFNHPKDLVGKIIKNPYTDEKSKVISVRGDDEYAWVIMMHLRYQLEYSNYLLNIKEQIICTT